MQTYKSSIMCVMELCKLKKKFYLPSCLTIILMLWHANDDVPADCHGNLSVTQVSELQVEAAATAADNTNMLSDTKEPAKVLLS